MRAFLTALLILLLTALAVMILLPYRGKAHAGGLVPVPVKTLKYTKGPAAKDKPNVFVKETVKKVKVKKRKKVRRAARGPWW